MNALDLVAFAKSQHDKMNGEGPHGHGATCPTGDDWNDLYSAVMELEKPAYTPVYYTAYVTVTVPVGLAFDHKPLQSELYIAALENFLDHPASKYADDLVAYVDNIVYEVKR